jgi:CBS domain-containing protein
VGLKLAAFGGSLGLANLWLGAFNLIPGSPLDGGRILHSVVWGLTGNARKATRFAGLAGQLFGIGMIVLGMLQMLTAQGMHGLWLILIGWYLLGAASREVAADSLRERLSDLTARDVMLTDCPIVPPAMTLDQFERKIAQRTDRNCFPVMGGGRVTGLITLDDLRSVPRNERARMTVGTVMKRVAELPAVPPEARAYEVLQQMARTDLHEMAVVESGEWRGIITLDGILARWRHDPRPGMPG